MSLPSTRMSRRQPRTSHVPARTARGLNLPSIAGSIFTLVMAAVWFFPLYWAVNTSLKPEHTVPQGRWLPMPFSTEAYAKVLSESNLLRWLFNSVFTALIITALVIVLSMLCAYALSQLQFPGKNLIYWALMGGIMIPFHALAVPLFIQMAGFGWVNTYQGLIAPQVIAPITVIVYKQFFDQVPRELRDSAVIDGAGEGRILLSLFLPINWGVTWALAIVTFIGAWNNFFWPYIITTSETIMTIPVGITQVNDMWGVQYARTMAVAVLAGLPATLAYLIFQKRVTQGVIASAGLKG